MQVNESDNIAPNDIVVAEAVRLLTAAGFWCTLFENQKQIDFTNHANIHTHKSKSCTLLSIVVSLPNLLHDDCRFLASIRWRTSTLVRVQHEIDFHHRFVGRCIATFYRIGRHVALANSLSRTKIHFSLGTNTEQLTNISRELAIPRQMGSERANNLRPTDRVPCTVPAFIYCHHHTRDTLSEQLYYT